MSLSGIGSASAVRPSGAACGRRLPGACPSGAPGAVEVNGDLTPFRSASAVQGLGQADRRASGRMSVSDRTGPYAAAAPAIGAARWIPTREPR